MYRLVLLAIGALLVGCVECYGEQVRLDLSSLERWKPITFPWAPRHSTYTAQRIDGRDVIRVQSNESVSGLEYRRVFETERTPIIEWSWKAMNVLAAGNAETRRGDDYPVRVYVMFPYEAELVPLPMRAQYELLKGILGYYPPWAVLNYVWANRPHAQNPIRNAYSKQSAMFFLDSGTAQIGKWRAHRVNIIEDFRRAFHRNPPETFTLAIMGDSINTGGSTDAYVRDIVVASG